MKVAEALFREPYDAYRVPDDDDPWAGWDDDDWAGRSVEPLMGPTLAADYVPDGFFQGLFVIRAQSVPQDGQAYYVDVVLPERISEHRFVLVDGAVQRIRGRRTQNGVVIPSLAIEKPGNYWLYRVEGNWTAGIEVLERGLQAARDRNAILPDLAYLTRDAGRHEDAIRYFTELIASTDQPSYFWYHERARIYDKLGKADEASTDRALAASAKARTP